MLTILSPSKTSDPTPIKIHLKLDTGMHRLGFLKPDIEDLCSIINQNKQIQVVSIFSHLSAAPKKNFQGNVIGIWDKYQLTDNIQFVNVLDKEGQDKLTPDEILQILKEGNKRFVEGHRTEKYYKHQVNGFL